jgi:hypothetical protein
MDPMSPGSLTTLGARHGLPTRIPFHPLVAVLAGVFTAVTILGAQQPKELLKNENVVAMAQAGIDDATIVKMIEAGATEFDTSPGAVITLKKAGVSNRVIDAMVSAARQTGSQPAAGVYQQPDEVGVYVNLRERLVPLKIEVITWRSGGALKSLLTTAASAGFAGTRGHLNGLVNTPMSPMRLESAPSPEFIIYCPEGTSAEEYQLLRFWEKKDRREFRLTTGGVVHYSGGADMNLTKVDVARLGPRFYRVTPSYPLQQGEFGFLPPGAAVSANAASAGRIHTFAIKVAK